MNVSTRQLRAFLALAEERSFTRAAAQTHLSQPAFSALIRSLEDTLGLRLFDRSTRHVEPTAEGLEFEVSARRVLAEFDGAVLGVRDQVARRRGRVSIALLPSLAAGWLPQVLAGFRARVSRHRAGGQRCAVRSPASRPCAPAAPTSRWPRRGPTRPSCAPSCSAAMRFHLVCPTQHPLASVATVRPRDVAA